MKQNIRIFIFLGFWLNSFAQTPQENLDLYSEKYPDTKLVLLKDYTTITIDINKDNELDIKQYIYESNLILDKKASRYNEGGIQYSELIALDYIKAKTLYPDTKKYKEYKVSDDLYSTKDKIGGSVFFDDTKEVSFIYPKLEQGAQRVLEYQLDIKEPRFLGSFYFQSSRPTEEAKLEVITDEAVHLGYKLFNTDTFDIEYTKETKKGKTYHTWTAKEVGKFKYESSSLSASYFLPHVVLHVKDYDTKEGNKKVLSSVDDLHNWYYSLVKDVNTQENEMLKSVVDSLITETDNDLDKVKKVYDWVQSNIKYIAFEAGYGGLIPREAVDVCNKRYGDCKDMSSIITEMLEIANVKADLTWIGTRDIPYTYEEVFTPNVDNHMIASYTDKDGQVYFLDATSSYLPFGMVSEFIQGKQAMINVGDGKYKLAKVPITPAEKNYIYDSTAIKLKDQTILGYGKFAITGYPKVKYSYFYPTLTSKEKKDYVKNAFEKGNNKFTVSETESFNFDDKTKASTITYDFQIDNYITQSDDEVYINLHLDKYLKGKDFDDDRKLPYDIEHKYVQHQVVDFEVPDGYELSYIPEDDNFENDHFSFSIRYIKKANKLKLVSIVRLKTIVVEPEDFEAWNKMIKKLNKNYSEVVILKKK